MSNFNDDDDDDIVAEELGKDYQQIFKTDDLEIFNVFKKYVRTFITW